MEKVVRPTSKYIFSFRIFFFESYLYVWSFCRVQHGVAADQQCDLRKTRLRFLAQSKTCAHSSWECREPFEKLYLRLWTMFDFDDTLRGRFQNFFFCCRLVSACRLPILTPDLVDFVNWFDFVAQLKLATKFWYPMSWEFWDPTSMWRFEDRYDEFGYRSFTNRYQKSEIFLMVKFENVWRLLGRLNDIKRVTQIWQLDHKIVIPENHDFVQNVKIFQNLSTKKLKS